jgi:predicted exporter
MSTSKGAIEIWFGKLSLAMELGRGSLARAAACAVLFACALYTWRPAQRCLRPLVSQCT